MRFVKRIEKRFVCSKFFAYTDVRLGRDRRACDAVVVAGFWRSGTTFLLEVVTDCLRARSFFEPLHFRVPRARTFHSPHRFETRGRILGETCPYVDPSTSTSALDDFLEDMLRGRVSTEWTRKARSARFVLASPVVVKLVRGNLLLAYIERRYSCRSLFVLRHPCAVVASFRRGEANQRLYSSDEFLEVLLDQDALREDHLLPHWDHIQRSRRSAVGRLTLAYAIMNLVPLRERERGLYHPCQLSFEELTLRPGAALAKVAEYLGLDIDKRSRRRLSRRDSLTTKKSRERTRPRERCFSWRHELEAKEIEEVYGVCEGFGAPLTTQIAAIEGLA